MFYEHFYFQGNNVYICLKCCILNELQIVHQEKSIFEIPPIYKEGGRGLRTLLYIKDFNCFAFPWQFVKPLPLFFNVAIILWTLIHMNNMSNWYTVPWPSNYRLALKDFSSSKCNGVQFPFFLQNSFWNQIWYYLNKVFGLVQKTQCSVSRAICPYRY